MKTFLTGALLLFFCGCSTFNKEWEAAVKNPATQGIEGAWAGDWRSEKNGHHGSIRCVVKKETATLYRAHFRAKYMKVFQFTYEAMLQGIEKTNVVALRGETDLGALAGGIYKYEGTATPADFHSRYESKYDRGLYEMKRPAK